MRSTWEPSSSTGRSPTGCAPTPATCRSSSGCRWRRPPRRSDPAGPGRPQPLSRSRSAARDAPPPDRRPRRTIDGVTPDLATTLKNLPARPGVYLMRDSRGMVLYVGKAQSLRSRVRSYWQKQSPYGEAHRIRSVIDRVADLEYTLTDSVAEALLLEANLIKRFKPRFNVRLKDDKSYPYIKITLADDFPRVERTRKLVNDGSRYFGPYASASSVDESMNLIRRLFPFRTCTIEIREGKRALARPCLLYHITVSYTHLRAPETDSYLVCRLLLETKK